MRGASGGGSTRGRRPPPRDSSMAGRFSGADGRLPIRQSVGGFTTKFIHSFGSIGGNRRRPVATGGDRRRPKATGGDLQRRPGATKRDRTRPKAKPRKNTGFPYFKQASTRGGSEERGGARPPRLGLLTRRGPHEVREQLGPRGVPLRRCRLTAGAEGPADGAARLSRGHVGDHDTRDERRDAAALPQRAERIGAPGAVVHGAPRRPAVAENGRTAAPSADPPFTKEGMRARASAGCAAALTKEDRDHQRAAHGNSPCRSNVPTASCDTRIPMRRRRGAPAAGSPRRWTPSPPRAARRSVRS